MSRTHAPKAAHLEVQRKWLTSNRLELEEALRELGDRYSSSRDSEPQVKTLWIQTMQEAILVKNLDLCSLLLNRLNLKELDDILTQGPVDSALKIIANYFQMDEDPNNHADGTRSNSNSLNLASESKSELALLRLASDNETEENFDEAVARMQSSGCLHAHVVRVTMKRILCTKSPNSLQEYCLANEELHSVWFHYLLECQRPTDAYNFSALAQDKFPWWNLSEANQSIEEQLIGSLPNLMRKFINSNQSKWCNKKQLELIISVGAAGTESHRLLAELTARSLEQGDVFKAMQFALGLGLADLVIEQFLSLTTQPVSLESVSEATAPYHARSRLHNHIVRHIGALSQPDLSYATVLSAFVSLGLIDELVRHMQRAAIRDVLPDVERQLADMLESGDPVKLSYLDPSIAEPTFKSTLSFLREQNGQDLNVDVLILIIMSVNAFLVKSEAPEGGSSQAVDIKLECMFDYLAEYLDCLTFSAHDSLIQATNNLIVTVKSKLELLADSERIKESFKRLIEGVAARCLIESRYKSAALLYSQVEDNVNASKSLMRTGDAETVMNFALLVRDITVTRITINYIKHLKVAPKTIEHFIARSNM